VKVTFDANMFPCDDLIELCDRMEWEVCRATTTDREFRDTSFSSDIETTTSANELCILNLSSVNASRLGNDELSERLKDILRILSDGSYPINGQATSDGEKRQFHDALTFEAHLANNGDIFVTNDKKAFINHGKRERLQDKFETVIMTGEEFREYIGNSPV